MRPAIWAIGFALALATTALTGGSDDYTNVDGHHVHRPVQSNQRPTGESGAPGAPDPSRHSHLIGYSQIATPPWCEQVPLWCSLKL